LRALIEMWYSRIPAHERDKPVLSYRGRLYTPSDIYREVVAGTRLGEELQRLVEAVRLSTSVNALVAQFWGVGKARALKWVEALPENFSIVAVDGSVVDKKGLRMLIEAERGLGAKAIETEALAAIQLLKA